MEQTASPSFKHHPTCNTRSCLRWKQIPPIQQKESIKKSRQRLSPPSRTWQRLRSDRTLHRPPVQVQAFNSLILPPAPCPASSTNMPSMPEVGPWRFGTSKSLLTQAAAVFRHFPHFRPLGAVPNEDFSLSRGDLGGKGHPRALPCPLNCQE